MYATSKANFINSVAVGQTVPCPECGAGNKPGSKFCTTCGAKIEGPVQAKAPAFTPVADEQTPAFKPAAEQKVSAFAPVAEQTTPAFTTVTDAATPAFASVNTEPVSVAAQEAEQVSAFAEGLPAWDVIPPQIVVRRR